MFLDSLFGEFEWCLYEILKCNIKPERGIADS